MKRWLISFIPAIIVMVFLKAIVEGGFVEFDGLEFIGWFTRIVYSINPLWILGVWVEYGFEQVGLDLFYIITSFTIVEFIYLTFIEKIVLTTKGTSAHWYQILTRCFLKYFLYYSLTPVAFLTFLFKKEGLHSFISRTTILDSVRRNNNEI